MLFFIYAFRSSHLLYNFELTFRVTVKKRICYITMNLVKDPFAKRRQKTERNEKVREGSFRREIKRKI